MDPTMLAVVTVGATLLTVGVSLAAIILTGLRSLRTEIAAVETRLGKRIADTKSELRAEMNALENRLRGEINAVETRLGKRIERLEDQAYGLLGLRRSRPPDPTPDESPPDLSGFAGGLRSTRRSPRFAC